MSQTRIDVWYGNEQTFGYNGNPQRWINVLGRAASLDGIDSVRWELNGDDALDKPLPLEPTAFRLLGEGDQRRGTGG